MIVKILFSKTDNRIYITSKPSHSGRDRQHSIDFSDKPSQAWMDRLGGKTVAYFQAHLKEDSLVIDEMIEDQRW